MSHGHDYSRGIPQLASGVMWIIFGAVMAIRSIRKSGITWPLRWHLIAGLAMTSAGLTFIIHGIYWMGWVEVELNEWQLVFPLWSTFVLTGWAFCRWVTEPDEK